MMTLHLPVHLTTCRTKLRNHCGRLLVPRRLDPTLDCADSSGDCHPSVKRLDKAVLYVCKSNSSSSPAHPQTCTRRRLQHSSVLQGYAAASPHQFATKTANTRHCADQQQWRSDRAVQVAFAAGVGRCQSRHLWCESEEFHAHFLLHICGM